MRGNKCLLGEKESTLKWHQSFLNKLVRDIPLWIQLGGVDMVPSIFLSLTHSSTFVHANFEDSAILFMEQARQRTSMTLLLAVINRDRHGFH